MADAVLSGPTPTTRQAGAWNWVVGFTAPIVATWMFWMGWDLMDRPAPDMGAAAAVYIFTFLLGAGGMVFVILRHQHQMMWTGVLGGNAGLVLALVMAGVAQDGYNDIVVPFVMLWFVVPAIVIGYGLTVLVLWLRKVDRFVLATTMAWCFILCAGALGAAFYHLVTLTQQEQRAIEAYEAPGIGVLVSVAALAVLAWLSRRSRC